MEQFILLFQDYTFQIVALGSAILGMICGLVGTFTVLRKESLISDGISHSALPGVVLAYLITKNKNIEILLLGAMLSGMLSIAFIQLIIRYSKIKFDSALAFMISVFFGIGMVLLTVVQKIPSSNQAGLSSFIFGQASTLLKRDIFIMILGGLIVLILVFLYWQQLKLSTFDREYFISLGFSGKKMDMIFYLMVVITIIIGLQTVGVILMSALLISPALSARQWTNKLHVMAILSSIFGALSGFIGTAISSSIPKYPTGPSIVIIVSIILLFSILFSPKRGLLSRMYLKNRVRNQYMKKIKEEA